MKAAARIGLDKAYTGHLCSIIVPIQGSLQSSVYINGVNGAVVGDMLQPHKIKVGKKCLPHTAVINAGSSKVFFQGIPSARIGDSADMGSVTTGSPTVYIGG